MNGIDPAMGCKLLREIDRKTLPGGYIFVYPVAGEDRTARGGGLLEKRVFAGWRMPANSHMGDRPGGSWQGWQAGTLAGYGFAGGGWVVNRAGKGGNGPGLKGDFTPYSGRSLLIFWE